MVTLLTLTIGFRGLAEDQQVLLTHGDTVTKVASDFQVIAQSGQIVAGRANLRGGGARVRTGQVGVA